MYHRTASPIIKIHELIVNLVKVSHNTSERTWLFMSPGSSLSTLISCQFSPKQSLRTSSIVFFLNKTGCDSYGCPNEEWSQQKWYDWHHAELPWRWLSQWEECYHLTCERQVGHTMDGDTLLTSSSWACDRRLELPCLSTCTHNVHVHACANNTSHYHINCAINALVGKMEEAV